MKKCYACGLTKDLSLFSKHRGRKDGYQFKCKECQSLYNKTPEIKERAKIRADKWYKENPDKALDKKYRKYGITSVDYHKMFREQDGKCAICSCSDSNSLHIDHNHETNKVRQLLCTRCNTSMGLAREDISILESMIVYLKKHSDHSYTGILHSATNAENSVQL